MKTIKMTTAQALVRFLDNQYLEFDGKINKLFDGIFTIFGHGNVLGLGHALEELDHDLKVYQGRNEQGMAHAAMGYAKQELRKKIQVCSSSVGPGAANMVTAAATATANRIPVLFLPGDTFATRQPDPVLQQIEHFHDMSITTNDSFRAVSKYWDRINRPEQLMSAMLNAVRVLTDPVHTGAVTISLPQDVQGEAAEYPEDFFKKRIHKLERDRPSETSIDEAVRAIKNSKTPFMICGGGVKYSEAGEQFEKFTEKFKIPFGETQAGKSAVVWNHPQNLGGIGTTGNKASNTMAKEADLVIGVGTRYTDFTTASKWLFQNPNVKFININVGSFDAGKMDAIKIVGDAKVALMAIEEGLGNYKAKHGDKVEKVKDSWMEELNRIFNIKYTGKNFIPEISGHLDHVIEEFGNQTKSYLTQTSALGILDRCLEESSVIVGAAGSLPGDLQRVWRPKKPNTYHMEYGYSCMGYEVSAALGVKISVGKGTEVYTMVGDGSYMMLHSELVTSIQEKQKINILLFDNMSFGCINNLQMGNGMGSFGTEFRYRCDDTKQLTGDLIPIDFAKNAESYGCKTYSVKTEEEFIAAIEDSKKQSVSTLIDIKILPKTMTDGYGAWWRVAGSQITDNKGVQEAVASVEAEVKKVRKY